MTALPPGQFELAEFPRFGLDPFADKFPNEIAHIRLQIAGDVATPCELGDELAELPRVEQTSDFHCVTTWSRRALRWSGYRFRDLYEQLIVPRAQPEPAARFVVLRGQDGYRSALPLEDLLADDVLLADRLDGAPLPLEHGAPVRLVAPAHYGYKNLKHLSAIELWRDERNYHPPGRRFMDHPRARVAHEERGRGLPGWLLRYLYRPFIRSTIRRFQRALDAHRARQ